MTRCSQPVSLWALIFLLAVVGLAGNRSAAEQLPPPVQLKQGKLVYIADAKGNRVPDFSHAGFAGGATPWPAASNVYRVEPGEGDDTLRIQTALDRLAQQPLREDGTRGAVLLAAGEFQISGQLRLSHSGVVLRGSGKEGGGTVLLATGTDRRALIAIEGNGNAAASASSAKNVDLAAFSPVGATSIRVSDSKPFRVGARVRIVRPSPKNWIRSVGMHEGPARSGFSWKEGTLDVAWDRVVTGIQGNELSLDAPLTLALDPEFGGAKVEAVESAGEVMFVGVENLACISSYDTSNPKDEEHAWIAVSARFARDCWVSDLAVKHFVYSAVYLGEGTSRITVQDCVATEPVSEDAGYRRHTFFTAGQQTLFRRCSSRSGRHDFVTGYLAAGPNVFLQCHAIESTGFSGSVGSWASGILFDNVNIDGGELRLDNLETWNQGVGWSAANSMIWQSKASRMISRIPPGAMNWAVGVWAMFVGEGRWSATSEFADPDSLYDAQLAERTGKGGEVFAPRRYDLSLATEGSSAEPLPAMQSQTPRRSTAARLSQKDGWLISGDMLLIGSEQGLTWWRGQLNPSRAREIGPALTRFVPGRMGAGLTDDLSVLAKQLKSSNRVVVRPHWGLWYDRRSDDHQMVRRPDADAWPPFYEQPWLRSGQGVAWDGLSKYDLAKFNPWYFARLRAFAEIAEQHGLAMINEMYFQHNILEAGAHWASFPWRPTNALQPTGFPEPPPYEGDKRVFMAEAFYDVSHPIRRELHRLYIRKCLDNLRDQSNVVHTLGAEYSGPLHFMQFWLDVVGEWMRETGATPLIALSAPKDVQDAILADAERSRLISVIDFTYWWQSDKGLFAPQGGRNLAPRQHQRLWKGGRPSASSLAAMVREYRTKFPAKAIMSGLDQPDPWAFVAAGGSIPSLPASTNEDLLRALAGMRPVEADADSGVLALQDGADGFFAYIPSGETWRLECPASAGGFSVRQIDRGSGTVLPEKNSAQAGTLYEYKNNQAGPAILWLVRN